MNSSRSCFTSGSSGPEAEIQKGQGSKDCSQHHAIKRQLEHTFDHFFRFFTILVIIGTAVSALRIKETGLLFSYPVQWFCVLMLLLVNRLRHKMPYCCRLNSLLIIGMVFGSIGIFAHGLLGKGFLVLMLTCIVVTIGGRVMHGYIVTVLSTLIILIAGLAFHQGWLPVQVNPSSYLVSPIPWITTALIVLVIFSLVANFLGSVKELWLQNIIKLEQSEAKYRLLFESAADSIFIMKGEKFIECNQKTLDMFKCTNDKIIDQTPYIFSPEQQPDGQVSSLKAKEKIAEALTGKPQFFEWTHTRCDGTSFIAEVTLNRLDMDGDAHLQAIVRDITERKNAETELQNKERQQSLILRSLPMAIYVAEPLNEHGIRWVSEQIENITGFTTDQFIAEKEFWHTRLHEEDKEHTIATFENITEKEIIETEYRWQHADGTFRWFRDVAALVRDEQGKPKEIVGTWVDITEQKLMREEIDRTTRKFMDIIDMLPLIVFKTDNNGRLVFFNRQAYELLGYSEEDLSKNEMQVLNFISSEDREKAARNMRNILAGNEPAGNEYDLIRKDGTFFPAFIFSRKDAPTDEKSGLTGFIVDITSQKKVEKEKRQLESQLRQSQKLEAIGTLAGGIAHDFNNILTPLLLHTEMSLLELSEENAVRNHLNEVMISANRAKDLVRQILEFSRKGEQDRLPVQLKNICKEVIRFIRASIPMTIEIKQNLQDNSYILADPVQMHQVLLNLCTNAAYAMKEDPVGILEISIDMQRVEESNKNFPAQLESGNYQILTVRDTGCGMTEENRLRIFDPFFTTKDRGEGTGLGLSVVHGIIASHGGAIVVDSHIGEGSLFTVYLPVLDEIEVIKSERKKQLPTGTEKVLLVDDEVELVAAMKKILGKLGYQVEGYTDPHEILEVFKNNPEGYDLVITDLTMPKMTGIELAGEIFETRPDMPIILMSGLLDERKRQDVIALGIKKCISKPVSMGKMAVVLREALEEKKLIVRS